MKIKNDNPSGYLHFGMILLVVGLVLRVSGADLFWSVLLWVFGALMMVLFFVALSDRKKEDPTFRFIDNEDHETWRFSGLIWLLVALIVAVDKKDYVSMVICAVWAVFCLLFSLALKKHLDKLSATYTKATDTESAERAKRLDG